MSGIGKPESQKRVKEADDKEVVIYAAAICSGFLSTIEEQLWSIRHPGEEWPTK
jgi:hypothetical protein